MEKKKKTSHKEFEKHTEITAKLREVQQAFIDDKVQSMQENIEQAQQDILKEIIHYAETHKIVTKFDKEGNPLKVEVKMSPIVITNYFFKPIIPLNNQEPQYNAEKLSLVFDYYCYILAEINDKIGYFPSSLTNFCKLAGITMTTLRTYKNSADYSMRVLVEKIYDQIGDENITMSQLGKVNERSTIFKLKSQNEMIETAQPTVNINIVETPDMNRINERINKYKQFVEKRK